MKFKRFSLSLIFILIFSLLFASQEQDNSLIINSALYSDFKSHLQTLRFSKPFINTPESELVLLREKIPGIYVNIKLSPDKKKMLFGATSVVENTTLRHEGSIIRQQQMQSHNSNSVQNPTRNPNAAGNAGEQSTGTPSTPVNPQLSSTLSGSANLVIKQLYLKEINTGLNVIGSFKKIVEQGYAYILIADNSENLGFFQISVPDGRIERKWNLNIKPHFRIKKKKIKPLIFDPLQKPVKTFSIRRFAIHDGKILVLTSSGVLSIIDMISAKILWQMDQTNPLCSLTVQNGIFYYVHSQLLYARELKSGKIIYSEKIAEMGYQGNAYVFSVNNEIDAVLVGIPSRVGFSVYRKKDGKWLYSAPFKYLAIQAASINRFGLPGGSALTYAYHQGVVYISWYDQWKPDMTRGWLTAHNLLDAKVLWNVPLRYNNGTEVFEAKRIETLENRIRLYSRTHIIILRPGSGSER